MSKEILDALKKIEIKLGLQKEIFNMDDFCAFTGFSKQFAYKLTSSGSIRFTRPSGKQIFFHIEDVKAFLLQNPSISNKEIELKSHKFL